MSAEQSYDPAPPPDPTQFGDLANKRGAFLKELDSDPRLMLRLTNPAIGSPRPKPQSMASLSPKRS